MALCGAIAASVEPLLGLAPNRNFVFEPTTPDGAASSYRSSVRLGVSTSAAGTVEIGAPVAASQIALISQERVGIGAGASLRATGVGNSLVVAAAGRQYRNDAGTDVLATTASGARWLLYVDGFAGLVGSSPPRAISTFTDNSSPTRPPRSSPITGTGSSTANDPS